MRLRNPAESITWTAVMVGTLCLLSATNASAALSGTFNASGSTTGNTVISGLTTGPFTVGTSGPGFCVGPPNQCGTGSGLSDSTSVSGTQVTFSFSGSTAGAGPGSFTINLTGFTSPITGVSLASGALGGATITDSAPTSSSLRFTFTTGSDYNAIGGNTVVFNVTTAAAVPEPSSVVLLSTFLAGAVFIGRRRLLVRGSRA